MCESIIDTYTVHQDLSLHCCHLLLHVNHQARLLLLVCSIHLFHFLHTSKYTTAVTTTSSSTTTTTTTTTTSGGLYPSLPLPAYHQIHNCSNNNNNNNNNKHSFSAPCRPTCKLKTDDIKLLSTISRGRVWDKRKKRF